MRHFTKLVKIQKVQGNVKKKHRFAAVFDHFSNVALKNFFFAFFLMLSITN